MKRKPIRSFLAIFLLLLLSACNGISVSPEAAATKMLFQNTTARMQVEQATIEVRQTVALDDSRSVVLLAFQGTRPELGPVTCLYTYQTQRRIFGWITTSGGGGCHAEQPDQPVEDLEVIGGHYSGERPNDPGYTQIYGTIQNPDIAKVRITWDDNVVTDKAVVNATVFTQREGAFMMKMVEGLTEEGQVVYTNTFSTSKNGRP